MTKGIKFKSKIHFRAGRNGRKRLETGETPTPPAEPGRLPHISKLMALAIRFDGLVYVTASLPTESGSCDPSRPCPIGGNTAECGETSVHVKINNNCPYVVARWLAKSISDWLERLVWDKLCAECGVNSIEKVGDLLGPSAVLP